jgi:hypothetical protein
MHAILATQEVETGRISLLVYSKSYIFALPTHHMNLSGTEAFDFRVQKTPRECYLNFLSWAT